MAQFLQIAQERCIEWINLWDEESECDMSRLSAFRNEYMRIGKSKRGRHQMELRLDTSKRMALIYNFSSTILSFYVTFEASLSQDMIVECGVIEA